MNATIIEFAHRARIRPPPAPPATTVTGDRPDAAQRWPFAALAGDAVMAAIAKVMAPHRATMAALDRVMPKVPVDPGLARLSALFDQHRKMIEGPLHG